MANTAHVYQTKSGNWNFSFHHPICREGSIGKKIHRGLKVSDEKEALRLQGQINALLALADKSPSLIPPRSIAERNYAKVIVDAFFDCMTPEPIDYFSLREENMPLPPKSVGDHTVPRALFVGPTGVGKTRLIQHILGTTQENFPMRGAGRTTVADTEIVGGDLNFSAVITFFSENEIRQVIKENIIEACSFAYDNEDRAEIDKAKIASKILRHYRQ